MQKNGIFLNLEISTSIEDKHDNNQLRSKEKNKLIYSSIEMYQFLFLNIIYYSCPEKAIFKKEGFTVESKCIKNLGTGDALTAAIDPNDIEVYQYLILN